MSSHEIPQQDYWLITQINRVDLKEMLGSRDAQFVYINIIYGVNKIHSAWLA